MDRRLMQITVLAIVGVGAAAASQVPSPSGLLFMRVGRDRCHWVRAMPRFTARAQGDVREIPQTRFRGRRDHWIPLFRVDEVVEVLLAAFAPASNSDDELRGITGLGGDLLRHFVSVTSSQKPSLAKTPGSPRKPRPAQQADLFCSRLGFTNRKCEQLTHLITPIFGDFGDAGLGALRPR